MTRLNIPLSSPDVSPTDIDAVIEVLRSPTLSLGPKLEEFEQAIAAYTGTSYAIGVSSGTAGLHLCMLALGIGPEHEVIVPSFTFIAVANAVRYVGANPVFVDIDPVTLNMDPEQIENAVTSKTRAVVCVHTFGYPANMDALLSIAKHHGLLIIEDACEALGSEFRGKKIGTLGDAGVFAFYPNKQITTGEGGMVVTRDYRLASKIRALRNQGRYPTDEWFQYIELGFNYRLSEIQCALGLAQMKRIETILTTRATIASTYHQLLENCTDLVRPPVAIPKGRISWFVYVVRLHERFTRAQRDAILRQLATAEIGCGRYFAPIHMQPSYEAWRHSSKLPITESVSARTIALPFFNKITRADLLNVCSVLTNACTAMFEARRPD
ncbi:MAG TPA: DegT/DnrJ/EryC1/StrS family aminotransferase [Candidatus Sulfotelmatobacter sp.]